MGKVVGLQSTAAIKGEKLDLIKIVSKGMRGLAMPDAALDTSIVPTSLGDLLQKPSPELQAEIDAAKKADEAMKKMQSRKRKREAGEEDFFHEVFFFVDPGVFLGHFESDCSFNWAGRADWVDFESTV